MVLVESRTLWPNGVRRFVQSPRVPGSNPPHGNTAHYRFGRIEWYVRPPFMYAPLARTAAGSIPTLHSVKPKATADDLRPTIDLIEVSTG